MANITELKVKIGADASSLNKSLHEAKSNIDAAMNPEPLKRMSEAAESTAGTLEKIGGGIAKMVAGIGALGGLTAAIKSAVDAGDAVYTMAERMHVGAAEAAQLSRILNVTGGDTSTFSSAMMRLDKSFSASGEAGEKTRSVLEACGVQLADQNGKLLPLNDQLKNMADGYKTASQAGYGQEFLMNTLGVRGLALTKTLQEYNEAAEAAGKVEGIGLDPEEMHRIAMELKVVDMETNQVKLAFASALAPTVQELIPGLISGLAQTAVFIRENKDGIEKVAGAIAALSIGRGIVGVLNTIGLSAMNLWQQAAAEAQIAAGVQNEAQAEVTARHEAEIAKRIAAIERESQRQQAAAIKAAMKTTESAEEASAIIAEKCAEIEARAAATAERVAGGMRAAFAAQAEAAEVSAAETSAAMERVQLSAAEAGIRMTETHAAAAESALTASGAIDSMALAETGAGEAAVIAGTREVTAQNEAAAAAVLHGNEQELLATKELAAGEAGSVAGTKMVGSMGTAGAAVKNVTSAVFALAGGWLGVAAAVGYAVYKLHEWYAADAKTKQENTFYDDDGTKYEWNKDEGNWYQPVVGYNPTGSKGEVITDEDKVAKLNDAWYVRHANDEDYLAELEKQAEDDKKKAADDEFAAKIAAITAEKGKSAALAAAPKVEIPKVQTVDVPIGDAVLENAMSHLGEMWHGDNTADDLHQCAAFASAMLEGAGINGISDLNGDNMKEKAGSAYHEAETGYVPREGDIIEWEGHVGVYDGNGGYVARNSTGGVRHGSMDEASSYGFGALQGYISTADLTGGAQVQRTMDEAGKKALEAAKKIEQAKKDYANLFNTMDSEINAQTDTAYDAGMAKLSKNIQQKGNEINKIAAAGIDTKELKKKLTEYGNVMLEELQKKNAEARRTMVNDTRKALDEVRDDFADEAQAEYDITLEKLQKEKDERFKNAAKNKSDKEAQLAVDEWYNAQVLAAGKKRDKDMAESHARWISAMQNQGNTAAIIKDLQYNPDDRKNDLWLDGQKKLAKEYVDLWDKSHESVQSMVATAGADMYNNLSTSIADFIKGTKSAMDVVHDFGNTVLSTIAQIVAQRAAANMVNSLLGSVFGSIGGAKSLGISGGFGSTVMADTSSWLGGIGSLSFADGGSIVGAGTGRSDSIMAYVQDAGKFIRVSNGEFIMNERATAAYAPLLESLNAGKFADGGYIAAPTLSSGTAYAGRGSGGMAGSATGGVVVNIINNNGSDVKVQETHYDEGLGRYVCEIVLDHAIRDRGGFGTNLKMALGAK